MLAFINYNEPTTLVGVSSVTVYWQVSFKWLFFHRVVMLSMKITLTRSKLNCFTALHLHYTVSQKMHQL